MIVTAKKASKVVRAEVRVCLPVTCFLNSLVVVTFSVVVVDVAKALERAR
jgi:hypothetical protein